MEMRSCIHLYIVHLAKNSLCQKYQSSSSLLEVEEEDGKEEEEEKIKLLLFWFFELTAKPEPNYV